MSCAPGTMCHHDHDCTDHHCPGRPDHTPVARPPLACEALCICQHPEQECTGACEQVPCVPVAGDDHDLYQWPGYRPCYWLTVTAIALASLLILGSVAGYLYGRFGAVFWAWANLNF